MSPLALGFRWKTSSTMSTAMFDLCELRHPAMHHKDCNESLDALGHSTKHM